MNYKLAKKLKDAGFPQELGMYDLAYIDRIKIHQIALNDIEKNEHWVKIPTLSELIEACGDGFAGLLRITELEKNINGWSVVGSNKIKTRIKPLCELGETPLEAVAKLWLKLNK